MSIYYLNPTNSFTMSNSTTFLKLQYASEILPELPKEQEEQVKKTPKLKGGAIINVTEDHRDKLKKISDRKTLQELQQILDHQWVKNRAQRQNIPMNIAIVINVIAGQIFDLKKITIKNVHRFLVHQDQLDELKSVRHKFNKRMQNIISGIEDGSVKSISPDAANKLNPYLEKKFTYASAKSYAVQEAREALKEFLDLSTHSTGIKRTFSSSEHPTIPHSKKQRTDATNETHQTESFLPEEQFSFSPIDNGIELNYYPEILSSENEFIDWPSWDDVLNG